jgi:hypothetical protein
VACMEGTRKTSYNILIITLREEAIHTRTSKLKVNGFIQIDFRDRL